MELGTAAQFLHVLEGLEDVGYLLSEFCGFALGQTQPGYAGNLVKFSFFHKEGAKKWFISLNLEKKK